MIGIIFSLSGKIVEIRIDGTNCLFRTEEYGGAFVPIDSLRLNKKGVVKEHPDLKDNSNWRIEAIKRYKEHIKKMLSEIERANYVIQELKKIGYKPLYLQRKGFRPIKLDEKNK